MQFPFITQEIIVVQPITGQRDPATKARPKPMDSPPRVGEAIPTSDGDPEDDGKKAGGKPDSAFPDAKPGEGPETVGGETAEPTVDKHGKVGDPNKPATPGGTGSSTSQKQADQAQQAKGSR
jgi:hypothetical protein